MARIRCEYCSTEYETDMEQCPLCGTSNPLYIPDPGEPLKGGAETKEKPKRAKKKKKKGGARAARREDRIPRWICVLIAVFLGLAAIAASIYALYLLGIIGGKKEKAEEPSEPPAVVEAGDPEPAPQPEPEPISEPEPEPAPPSIPCTSLTLSTGKLRLEEVGASGTFDPRVLPSGCTEAINWVSSNPAVCSVDADGLATALSEGTAVITAACGEQTATAEVICDFGGGMELQGGARLDSEDVTLLGVDETVQLKVEDAPKGAEIVWSSDDEDVCTVEDGLVTAVGPGTGTITAEVDGEKLTCTVRCRFEGSAAQPEPPAQTGTGDRLDHDDVTIKVGETFEISVVNGHSGGWNVTDSSVISVDANGNVTGIGKGTANVYTTINGKRVECIVRVR